MNHETLHKNYTICANYLVQEEWIAAFLLLRTEVSHWKKIKQTTCSLARTKFKKKRWNLPLGILENWNGATEGRD